VLRRGVSHRRHRPADTGLTLDDLRREGFSEEIVLAVEHVTHRDGESYEEYIKRVKRNPEARRVKLADLEDNMDLLRIRDLQANDLERLRRYHLAWWQLSDTT